MGTRSVPYLDPAASKCRGRRVSQHLSGLEDAVLRNIQAVAGLSDLVRQRSVRSASILKPDSSRIMCNDRPITEKDIQVDARCCFPRGYHPTEIDREPDGRTPARALPLLGKPIKYYLVNFNEAVRLIFFSLRTPFLFSALPLFAPSS